MAMNNGRSSVELCYTMESRNLSLLHATLACHKNAFLIFKGLIIYAEYEDQLMLMSRSFRNYILTRLNKDEINKLQANEAEKGNWHKLRTILIVIILLVGIFLFTTQQEALNGLVAYLSAFSGGIFALLNIINKIPAGGK